MRNWAAALMNSTSEQLTLAAGRLSATVDRLKFKRPVAYVYNPLNYAWKAHEMYLKRHGNGRKSVLFLGMNPGPFGMAQTGVPFGEIRAVREWMGIHAPVGKPVREHPKRPVEGFACTRSEVSGRRLWGLFEKRFAKAENFFADHFVANYCPLVFVEETGANRTPDKLPMAEKQKLFSACDQHLREVVGILNPEWLIGIGAFAEGCARRVFPDNSLRIATLPHPSPANPAANRNWAGLATAKLEEVGVWERGGD